MGPRPQDKTLSPINPKHETLNPAFGPDPFRCHGFELASRRLVPALELERMPCYLVATGQSLGFKVTELLVVSTMLTKHP